MSNKKSLYPLLFLILINVPQNLLSLCLGFDRPWFFAEYVFAIFLIWISPYLALGLVSCLFLIELYCYSYLYFPGLGNLGFWGMIQAAWDSQEIYFICLFALFLYYWFLIFQLNRVKKMISARVMLLYVIVFGVMFAIFQYSPRMNKDGNAFYSLSTLILDKMASHEFSVQDSKPRVVHEDLESAVEKIRNISKYKNINLIVVEAWGSYKDSLLNDNLIYKFKNKSHLRVIGGGSIKSSVSTITAELRELCAAMSYGYGVTKIPDEIQCLPKALQENGYKNFSFHAGGETFYNRYLWYKSAGFLKSYFLKDFPKVERCDSNWPGVCDVRLVKSFIDRVAVPEKIFGYWMTLNSHYPYGFSDLRENSQKDCDKLSLSENAKVCANYLIIEEYLSEMAREMEGRSEDLKDSIFIFVGDHPPYVDRESMDKYFISNEVSYLLVEIDR